MSIPAICHNAHYLFEGGVSEFDIPVEIHVTRFSDNMKKISSQESEFELKVSNYPNYNIPFHHPSSFRVFINCNEPATSPHRETNEVVVVNHEQYDLILTSEKSIIENCPNAIFFPYGTTWLNKGGIDDENSLGVYSDTLDVLQDNKDFSLSFLCSFHLRLLEGYEIRKNLWKNKNHITIPKRFYSSKRMIIPNAPEWYVQQLEPYKGYNLPGDNKEILFNSQFHLSIESTKCENYFTEKLIDALITKTVPVYWGCNNIGDFFNERGIISINSSEDAIEKVNQLTFESYEEMKPYIEENFILAKEYASSFAKRVKKTIEENITDEKMHQLKHLSPVPFPLQSGSVDVCDREPNQKILTIGIPSLNERKESLNELLIFMNSNTNKENRQKSKVEIIVNIDDGEKTVGQKRNEILQQAKGKFICYVDDDDKIDEEYINLILKTIEENPELDCIGFTGMYYVNGEPTMLFKHAKEYGGHYKKEGIQYRPVNHLNPVRTELAQQIGFPEKNFGEDSDYCDRLLESGLVKNEVILDKVMYHYLWNSELTRTH